PRLGRAWGSGQGRPSETRRCHRTPSAGRSAGAVHRVGPRPSLWWPDQIALARGPAMGARSRPPGGILALWAGALSGHANTDRARVRAPRVRGETLIRRRRGVVVDAAGQFQHPLRMGARYLPYQGFEEVPGRKGILRGRSLGGPDERGAAIAHD